MPGRSPRKSPVQGKKITRGGRKLARFLKRHDMGLTEFAKKAGVDRVTLHRVINGERWRYINVDFALAVCDAASAATANGPLNVTDFASVTATEVDDEDGPHRFAMTGSG